MEITTGVPSLGFLMMILCTSPEERIWPTTFASLASIYRKVMFGVIFGNLVLLGTLLFGATRFLESIVRNSGYRSVLLAILVSSYLKIFLVAMMVCFLLSALNLI
ncbi:unnamed protein product [Cuscuta epithymum]|uniref:Protein ARV n=1 Tax=Cuscuta epithymum TaxID=186058 RepID=A0AAV0DG52_9ASTE|nr:unnamed protein product [Cuscuta epithymum]